MKVSCLVLCWILMTETFSEEALQREPNKEIAEISPTSVTQGKTFQNNENVYAAVHAIDKHLSTIAATQTDNEAGWLKLKFDKTHFIHKIIIYYRFYTGWYNPGTSCVQSETNFKECVDNDNNVDVSVYQGEVKQKSCGTLQLTYGLEQSDQIYTLLCNNASDTVKLSKNAGTISVTEIVVTGTERSKERAEITPTSVTQGKTYQNKEHYAAANVIDRDLSTEAITNTGNGTGWLKLQFDRTLFIHKIVIYRGFYTDWYTNSHSCYKSESDFRGCVDGDNNVDVSVYQGEVKQNSCGTLQLTYGLEQSDQIYTLVCNTEGDTVKFSKDTGSIAVNEVVVIGTERSKEIAEVIPTSVTQGNTSQNNENAHGAGHAIDRDLSTLAATHTDNGAGWLKLKLDRTHFIHKIIIYYRFYTDWYDPSYWCVRSEINFRACVDNDNNVDVSVYRGEVQQKSCGTLQLTYGLEQSDQIYTLVCNNAGDTVKLSKDTGIVAVTEVVVTRTERSKEIAEVIPTSVTQGKTYGNNEEDFAVKHAIDNDLSTESMTETDNGAGWLKLHFSRTSFIHKIIIYSRFHTSWFVPSTWCAESKSNFRACVDRRNNVDVSVYQGEVKEKSCGTLQLTYGLEQSDQIYTLLCNTEGNTVKLSKDTGSIAVTEVVFTGSERSKEIAEITPTSVTQGNTYKNEEKYAAANVIDRDLSTEAITDTGNGTGWLELQFDRTLFIHKIVIYRGFYTDWYTNSHSCYKSESDFIECVDGDNNVDVSVYQGEVKQKSCGTLQLTYGLEQSDQIYTLICNTQGDNVKLSKDTGLIAVNELVVMGTERSKYIAEITPTSVTQGKTYNSEECCAAVHVIDRDLSTEAITLTDNGAGWLKLQFDRTVFLHKIIIYYRFYTGWYNPSAWCVQSKSKFRSCVDEHNNVDVSVYQGEVKQKSCGTLQLTYGLEQSDRIYTLVCNTEGDTVKLSKDTGSIAMWEVAVIGTERSKEISEITPTSVTQGKTYQNKEQYAAANVIDRDLSTEAITDTGNGTGWLKLQLDRTLFIHKIVIYRGFYTDWYRNGQSCYESESDFRECVDSDNNVDVSVYQGEVKQKSCGTLQLTYGLEQSDQIYTLVCNTEGDTVKLSKDTGTIAVNEVVVIGTELVATGGEIQALILKIIINVLLKLDEKLNSIRKLSCRNMNYLEI
ncbi:hypothetical protein ACHWQZ_G003775 [Mnemiopsis leidyi]